MAQRVTRGEKILDKMENKMGLTEAGKQWLIGSIDPYHDRPLNVCGFPDGNAADVAVQVVKSSFNLQCPAGITTGTWDVLIMDLPWSKPVRLFTQSLHSGTNSNPGSETLSTNSGQSINIGGLQTISIPSGNSFLPSASLPSASNVYTPNVVADQYFLGNTRTIGKGFEVHNTTSDLNRQGMCTTFRIPMPSLDEAGTVVNYLDTASAASLVTYLTELDVPMWPQTQAEAVLTPGSRQWTAEQGAYMVSRLKNLVIPTTDTGFKIQPFVVGTDSSVAAQNLAVQGTQSILVTTPIFGCPNVFWDNFDLHGVIFSGLSLQTTLTVNYTRIIERQPDWTISDLVVLAKPPPERDNVALDLYTHITERMPIGVPVAENGLGDWFMDALSTAADFVAPVLSVVPGLGGVGDAIGAVNGIYKRSKAPAAKAIAKEVVKEERKYETNPYVGSKDVIVAQSSNAHGKTTYLTSGGTAKQRVAARNAVAVRNMKNNNTVGRAYRAQAANPFKGKSIPR